MIKKTKHTTLLATIGIVISLSLATPAIDAEEAAAEDGQHLFILSGQSNMAGLDPSLSFTPTVTKAFGMNRVLVVKDAHSGQSIRSWCKSNHELPPPTTGRVPKVRGELYEPLIKKVKATIKGQTLQTVTFVWMQGESDLNNTAYDAYLKELLQQLQSDLAFKQINLVIGRISDSGLDREKRLAGRLNIRRIQQEFAESLPHAAWVDTDDLNDRKVDGKIINDLHYTAEGYKTLGQRFAEKAITLIEGKKVDGGATVSAESQRVIFENGRLSNGIVSVDFDDDGGFSIRDAKTKLPLLLDSRFWLPRGKPGKVVELSAEEVDDALGKGRRVVLQVADFNDLGYWGRSGRIYANRIYTYTLYENNPALVCGFGLKLPSYLSMRLAEGTPLAGGQLFGGKEIKNPMTLNGSAGMDRTAVLPGINRRSPNSLMLTGTVDGQRRTAVWGGLGNEAFGKFTILQNGSPTFYASDPIGRLVDEEETYIPNDTFYIDVHTQDPFKALERYGWAMRLANNASPNIYDFPVLCGWSVSHISKLPNVNNSTKLIGELEHANQCGLTKYTKVSLRLEPDKYHGDTEQGWWDDAHMREFNHLVEPYDSIAKWSKAMNADNGVPYIYMQLGMPSDDFVRTYPQYMLFNDSSEVERTTPEWVPGRNRRQKHHHHQPYVTYDYTDKEFSKHFVKAWSKLRSDGIRGVKVDYPATAWRPEGGFDDRYATTNSAYRRAFALLREAFGKDGLIDERNLGESSRPCLDVTAGLVDTQRTWGDSNKFSPAMVSISGLRWYKNRTVFNYYPDTKAVHDCSPEIRQSLLTMIFLSSGRIDLATSFSLFTPEITHDFSRIYPHYREPKTARPLDAFTGVTDPQVYDLELNPDWHQIALFNTSDEKARVSTKISGERVNNAIGLDPDGHYHAYEFWSDTYLGEFSGTTRLERELEPNHCAMISVRKVEVHPQVLSTNRHVLQGWVELKGVNWDPKSRTFSGTAKVIGGEPFQLVVANNGAKPLQLKADNAEAKLAAHPVAGLSRLTFSASANTEVKWQLKYEPAN
ncbi:MAG: sialate O-acetylesterase [Pirellulaceae bacterium]